MINKAVEAKVETTLGALKEDVHFEYSENLMSENRKNPTVEQLLADGKVKRTVQENNGVYYIYYVLKPGAYESMNGMGKGAPATLKDVFLIDDKFNIKYIDSEGKEYGDKLDNKILEDETEIRFSSPAFGAYISRISGVTEEKMKFKWMKNQTTLSIDGVSIDSLEDLVFFPNLMSITISNLNLENLNGIENCQKLVSLSAYSSLIKDYSKITYLTSLKGIRLTYLENFNEFIDLIKDLPLERLEISNSNAPSIKNVSKLRDTLKVIAITDSNVEKIDGLESFSQLTSLSLSSNKIINFVDIASIKSIDNLKELNLRGNDTIDGNRENYSSDDLNKINRISQILDRGGKIFLDENKISLFTNYKEISFSWKRLENLNSLKDMTSLEKLDLTGTGIDLANASDKEIIKSMTNLKNLNLSFNQIQSLEYLNCLTNLQKLDIDHNSVRLRFN